MTALAARHRLGLPAKIVLTLLLSFATLLGLSGTATAASDHYTTHNFGCTFPGYGRGHSSYWVNSGGVSISFYQFSNLPVGSYEVRNYMQWQDGATANAYSA